MAAPGNASMAAISCPPLMPLWSHPTPTLHPRTHTHTNTQHTCLPPEQAETNLTWWARGHADIADFSPGYTVPYISGYVIRSGELVKSAA